MVYEALLRVFILLTFSKVDFYFYLFLKRGNQSSAVLGLPRNHEASRWQGREQSFQLGSLFEAPHLGLRYRQLCIESKCDTLSFELISVFQGLKL